MDGIIYILKFDPPFWHARYYVGWCNPRGLMNRIKQHRTGQGAHITRAAVEQGHRLILVADFPGTRDDERAIKRRKNTPKLVQQMERRGLLNVQRSDPKMRRSAATHLPERYYYTDESED